MKQNSWITRPPLDTSISINDFRAFYWLKKELADFCKKVGISAGGSKLDLAARIEKFLISGRTEKKIPKKRTSKTKKSAVDEPLSLDTIITPDFKVGLKNRMFFKSGIGPHFHYTVNLIKFARENVGKTYKDFIDEWYREQELKKSKSYKTKIAPQFEYNRYIREYLQKNKGKSLKEAVKNWNEYKKRRKNK